MTSEMPQAQDQITILSTLGPLLTKRWWADGTIQGHDQAKQHTLKQVPVSNIQELAAVLEGLRTRSKSCVIRGEYIGAEAAALIPDPGSERKGKYVLRQSKFFIDVAHYWTMFDLDGYEVLLADPVTEPVESIREWIRFNLPSEFWEISFYWQLSSSAGHPSKAGTLRAHIWFWMARPFTSAEMHAWVTLHKLPIDRAPFNAVQAHYVADPVMDPGMIDPVPVRGGFCEGMFGDSVEIEIDEGALAVAMLSRRARVVNEDGEIVEGEYPDPRQKSGAVGAFCRAFSVRDVLLAEWFPGDFTEVTDRRWTWNMPGHPPEGAFISEDGLRFTSVHNTAPGDTHNRPLNAYDLARVYLFGDLDETVPDEERWTWDAGGMRPSETAMRKWSKSLPEVAAEMETGPESDNIFAQADAAAAAEQVNASIFTKLDGDAPAEQITLSAALSATEPGTSVAASVPAASADDHWGRVMGKKLKGKLQSLGLTDDEIHRMIDGKVLAAAWRGCFYHAQSSRLYLLNKAGDLTLFNQAQWSMVISRTFGKMLDPVVVEEVSLRLSEETAVVPAKVAEELVKATWGIFSDFVMLYRQRGEIQYQVDIFADQSGVRLVQDAARVTYTHEDFPIRAVPALPEGVSAADIVNEYRAFFPQFDDLLDLILYARFANDRREAFLWMKCLAGWGKGLLLDGVLGKDGLGIVAPLSVKDIERAFDGAPIGIQASGLLRAWVLWVDEFKSAKGEIKQLNNNISGAPKNQLRFTVDVHAKVFTSAEGVESLAGSEGVEAQFADRFAMIEQPAGNRVSDLPLFQKVGKRTYRTILANHAAHFFNGAVIEMRALGLFAASHLADQRLSEFHSKYAISNTHALLSENLPGHAAEVKELIMDWARRQQNAPGVVHGNRIDHMPTKLRTVVNGAVTVLKGGFTPGEARDSTKVLVVVKRLQSVVQQWVTEYMDRSQQTLVGHKANDIATFIKGSDCKALVNFYALQPDGTVTRETVRGMVEVMMSASEATDASDAFMNAKVVPIR